MNYCCFLFAFLLTLLAPFVLKGQVQDSFSDGNHTVNPLWSGDAGDFVVNAQEQLQLKASGSGTSFLATPSSRLDSTEWRFWVKLDFSPSNYNHARIYLASSQQDLTGPLNGYYLRLGENGSQDAMDLYRQDSNSSKKILSGLPGRVSGSSNIVRIRITRTGSGQWTLWSDTLGGTNWQLEGTATDTTYQSTSWLGWVCKYTSSNASAFYMDDVYAGPLLVDTVPPQVQHVQVVDAQTLQLTFSESLDSATASEIGNYSISSIGNPTTARLDATQQMVALELPKPFQPNSPYMLQVQQVEDRAGNPMQPVQLPVMHVVPQLDDVIVNEVLPDPDPPVALPNVEFIELLNTSDLPMNLSGWMLSDESNTVSLPSFTLLPDSFIIITDRGTANLYRQFGTVLAVDGLPALNNGGDALVLHDVGGTLIDSIHYSSDWYDDAAKADGGWSLERISTTSGCSGSTNWAASRATAGGTPGTANSITTATYDTVPPAIASVQVRDSVTILLHLTESISPDNAQGLAVTSTLGQPQVRLVNDLQALELIFPAPFQSGQPVQVVLDSLTDCFGNTATGLSATFAYWVPQPAEPFDVLIHEFMADPEPPVALPDADWVELYNRSTKAIDLAGWLFIEGGDTVKLNSYILAPKEYVLLVPEADAEDLQPYGAVLPVNSFNLNATGELLVLHDAQGQVISALEYSPAWYQDEAKAEGGWSLEMRDPGNPCGVANNWAASAAPAGGTPGAANSVAEEVPDLTAPELLHVAVVDSLTLRLVFSERMDSSSLASTGNYNLSPTLGAPFEADARGPLYQEVLLRYLVPMSEGETYTLTISGLSDCAGNVMAEHQQQIALPQPLDSFDLVINEVLFDPWPGGSDFVELYNRSDKVIDLQELTLAREEEDGQLTDAVTLTEQGRLLFPGEYVALTEDREDLLSRYWVPQPEQVVEVASLPTLPNEEGNVVLINAKGEVIDFFFYHEDLHFPLLQDPEGVSLERLDAEAPTNDDGNWHSAASTAGYATPAAENSQSGETAAEEGFSLDSRIFSPDLDGYQDLLLIRYQFAEPGTVASLRLFTLAGQPVAELANGNVLGTQGLLRWDGLLEDGTKAPVGSYILHIEYFSLQGERNQEKFSISLARRGQ